MALESAVKQGVETMIRRTLLCLALTFPTWMVAAQDRTDGDALRSDYEAKFDELDANKDNVLDDSELKRLSPADLEALHRHGLPKTGPVARDVFVASGVAVASSVPTPPPESEPDSAAAKTEESAKSDESVKTEESSDRTKLPVPGITLRSAVRRSHFVPELPSEFIARDKNGDGQIALYEWERKKYAEFAKLDLNGDGFLTPAELLPKGALKTLYSKSVARSGGTSQTPATGTPGVVTAGAASGGEPDAIEKEARGTFAQMDDNKDGSLDESDWGRSRRTRPWFESAGITVSLPMNADTFVAHYRRAKESGGR
jgi:hypothetical protein